MCRSISDPCGSRRCKTTEQETLAKANWRARKKLSYQYESRVSPARAEKASLPGVLETREESYDEKIDSLLEIINESPTESQGLPLTLHERHTRLTAAYVELGGLIAERAGRDLNSDALLDEIIADREELDSKIVEQTDAVQKLREKIEVTAAGEEKEGLEKELAGLSRDTEKLLESRRQKNEKLEKFFTERQESYLKELKDIGVVFAEDAEIVCEQSSHAGAVKTVNSILKYFPEKWVSKANSSEPVIVKMSKKRSHYIAATLESKYKLVQNLKYTTKPAGWEPDRTNRYEMDYIQIPANEYGEAEYVNPETGKSMTVQLNDPTDTAWVVPEYEYHRGDDEPSNPSKWEKVQSTELVYNSETRKSEKTVVYKWRRPVRKRQEVEVVSAPKMVIPADDEKSNKHVYGVTNKQSVALHEMTHRLEHHNPDLKEAEKAFITHRAKLYTSEAEQLTEITPGEYGYRDNFASHYMGRDYEGEAYEIASVGFEALWFGRDGGHERGGPYTPDHEYRNFLLGLLASTADRK